MNSQNHTIDVDYIRNRITELRKKKGVSEQQMSKNIGHGKSYIQDVVSGRMSPPLSEFLKICEYLEVSPKDFFDTQMGNPVLANEVLDKFSKLDDDCMELILAFIDKLTGIDKNK